MAAAQAWHPVVRTIHWGVAGLVLVELLNEAGANPWHRYLGYAAALLVVARLAWGFGGVGPARLQTMTATASRAPRYLGALLGGGPVELSSGHTPPGALMAFVLWSLVLLVGVTGWMHGLDAFWGEEWLQQVHAWLAYALGAFAAVHIVAAVLTSRLHGANLVKGMITGEKAGPT